MLRNNCWEWIPLFNYLRWTVLKKVDDLWRKVIDLCRLLIYCCDLLVFSCHSVSFTAAAVLSTPHLPYGLIRCHWCRLTSWCGLTWEHKSLNLKKLLHWWGSCFSRNFWMPLVFHKHARSSLVTCVWKNIMVSGFKKVLWLRVSSSEVEERSAVVPLSRELVRILLCAWETLALWSFKVLCALSVCLFWNLLEKWSKKREQGQD